MAREFISLLGIDIDITDLQGLIQSINTLVYNKQKSKIMYANIHTMNIAARDMALRATLNNADLVYCDGEGVRLGARILGKILPQRMTGADWIWDLCSMCQERGYSVYLLGGEHGVGENAARKLQGRYPDLEITGTHHGYFQKHGKENDEVISAINEKSPDILFVGFGSPLQEKWIYENFEKLDAYVVWAVGAVADFVSGKVPRGPRWMLDNGLEWLFRLIVEPRRMWKRYIAGNALFFLRVLAARFSRRSMA